MRSIMTNAHHSRFPLTNVMWRVRGRLTLMLAVAANAPYASTARHLWFTNVTSACLSLPAHAAGVAGVDVFRAIQRAGWRMVLGAGQAEKPRR